jgi:aspartate 1-decarboxylase
MLLQFLKSKIQQLTVTESKLDYPGSISLPRQLLTASQIGQFELVHVNNKTNGNRIITYAVPNNSKNDVTVNGAASKLFNNGDIIHVLAYAYLEENEVTAHQPLLVITDEDNNIIETKPYIIC